jgi:hypothetical protein
VVEDDGGEGCPPVKLDDDAEDDENGPCGWLKPDDDMLNDGRGPGGMFRADDVVEDDGEGSCPTLRLEDDVENNGGGGCPMLMLDGDMLDGDMLDDNRGPGGMSKLDEDVTGSLEELGCTVRSGGNVVGGTVCTGVLAECNGLELVLGVGQAVIGFALGADVLVPPRGRGNTTVVRVETLTVGMPLWVWVDVKVVNVTVGLETDDVAVLDGARKLTVGLEERVTGVDGLVGTGPDGTVPPPERTDDEPRAGAGDPLETVLSPALLETGRGGEVPPLALALDEAADDCGELAGTVSDGKVVPADMVGGGRLEADVDWVNAVPPSGTVGPEDRELTTVPVFGLAVDCTGCECDSVTKCGVVVMLEALTTKDGD